MATGSIPMVGGHGTAGSFGPLLEQMGAQGRRLWLLLQQPSVWLWAALSAGRSPVI
ncbi:MAG: hypothetical protein ACLR2G_00505 [Phascolarctobacterium faecium]